MSNQGPATVTQGRIEGFAIRLLGWLKTGNPAETMDRCFESRHVDDLRFIIGNTLILLCISIVVLLLYTASETEWAWDHVLWSILKFTTLFTGLLTTVVAIAGTICAWAYKVGSARLGVVDLFACEISTLCRVALVTDTVGRFITRIERERKASSGGTAASNPEVPESREQANHNRPPSAVVMQFTSAENYFPVFEGNTRDLQSLEARVVINITSFYTYMKTVRDLMRSAAALKSAPVTPEIQNSDQQDPDTWHNAMRDMVYMLFLGLEAGRDSIEDLVEFAPEQVERTIVVLLSEFKAYLFLLKEFADAEEMHARRLNLRWEKYQAIVPKLKRRVKDGLRQAETKLEEAKKAANSPTVEISLRELELSVWRGADELLPALKALYRELSNMLNAPSSREGQP
jgi:hypothetical protein